MLFFIRLPFHSEHLHRKNLKTKRRATLLGGGDFFLIYIYTHIHTHISLYSISYLDVVVDHLTAELVTTYLVQKSCECKKNYICVWKCKWMSTINITLEAVLALRLRCVWNFGVGCSCFYTAFWKVASPELLRVIAVTLSSGQDLDFISIVIICDTQNMGVNTNLFFLQTTEKTFSNWNSLSFNLFDIKLFSNTTTPIIKNKQSHWRCNSFCLQ